MFTVFTYIAPILRDATHGLQTRFRIDHVTLQLMDVRLPEGACAP